MNDRDLLLSTREVTRRFGIPLQTLANRRSKNLPPDYYKIGRSIYYKETDILEWLEFSRVIPEARARRRR